MGELKACGVLVVRCDADAPTRIREFLLMQHPTRWDLPKGHVDPGEEDETATALRELAEETGIPADAVALDPTFRFQHRYLVRSKRSGGEEWPKTLVVFLGRLTRDVEIAITEHTGYRWFPWEPPHCIQAQTIDPLLAAVEEHLASSRAG
jgi:8-oxo-dGTP pyrophosphatase MutT (NUDIX family)